MPGDFEDIKRKLVEGYVRSSPLMDMMYRADEAGFGNILNPRNKPPAQRGPDDLQKQRGNMSEAEYRKYLADQSRQGQQMVDQAKPLQAPNPK